MQVAIIPVVTNSKYETTILQNAGDIRNFIKSVSPASAVSYENGYALVSTENRYVEVVASSSVVIPGNESVSFDFWALNSTGADIYTFQHEPILFMPGKYGWVGLWYSYKTSIVLPHVDVINKFIDRTKDFLQKKSVA